jgi:hypothetical protein
MGHCRIGSVRLGADKATSWIGRPTASSWDKRGKYVKKGCIRTVAPDVLAYSDAEVVGWAAVAPLAACSRLAGNALELVVGEHAVDDGAALVPSHAFSPS